MKCKPHAGEKESRETPGSDLPLWTCPGADPETVYIEIEAVRRLREPPEASILSA
jgi:hypothetical protein